MIKNLKKAFTIIELVIVIAVIAILAAVMIPTYSSLVEKANLSADEQAVQQMNKALKIYEAENGKKPKDKIEAKKALDENLINADTLVPVTQGYAFYWNPTENKVVLVGEGKSNAQDGWVLLTSTGYGSLETCSSVEEITKAISDSSNDEPILIKLENDIEISSSQSAIQNSNNVNVVHYVEKNNNVIIDLNGKTLTDNSTVAYSQNDKKDLPICTFGVEGTLTIKNGIIETANPRVFNVDNGSLSLNDVTINIPETNYGQYAMMIVGLSDVSIVNSKIINNSGFGLTSNSSELENDGARISVINSTIQSTKKGYAGIYFGTYVDLTIDDNCIISGDAHGLFLRGCNATIKNSKIYNTRVDGGIEGSKGWNSGNNGRCADIVFASGGTEYGDGYSKTGNYICENVTGNPDTSATNPTFTVIVHQPKGGEVNVSGIKVNQTFKEKHIYSIWGSDDVEVRTGTESKILEPWNPIN